MSDIQKYILHDEKNNEINIFVSKLETIVSTKHNNNVYHFGKINNPDEPIIVRSDQEKLKIINEIFSLIKTL
jgi:hypothetical protein